MIEPNPALHLTPPAELGRAAHPVMAVQVSCLFGTRSRERSGRTTVSGKLQMRSGYYKAEQHFPAGGRWYLGAVCDDHGRKIDTSVFFQTAPLDLGPPARLPLVDGGTTELAGPACIQLARSGPALAFTLGAFDLPVVSARLAGLLRPLVGEDAQFVPARVEGQDDPFEVVNVVTRLDCIDFDRSQVEWWTPPGAAPDAPQEPFAMYELVLAPTAAGGHQMFRPAGWQSAIIVSGEVKAVLERAGELGVSFRPV